MWEKAKRAAWRKNNPALIAAMKLRYYRRSQKRANAHQPWTIEELEMIAAHHMTDRELSVKFQRSIAAIQTQRFLMKKKAKAALAHALATAIPLPITSSVTVE